MYKVMEIQESWVYEIASFIDCSDSREYAAKKSLENPSLSYKVIRIYGPGKYRNVACYINGKGD